MNAYYFIIVPAMAIMCIVFAWIIAGDIKAILRSMRGSGKYDTVRHKTGRNYGKAAIFVGTACLFVGSPQECEELADDLWHYRQQAEVRDLTEDTVFDVLLKFNITNHQNSRVMKKQIKKATIVAMAAIAGTTIQSETEAMQAAFADMQAEYGESAVIIDINDPFGGFCA